MLSGLMSYVGRWSLTASGRFLIAAFVVSMGLFATLSYSLINGVKVNGQTYGKIIQIKDLVADILPPPHYIIESHLSVTQVLLSQEDGHRQAWLDNLARVEKEFQQRHVFWMNDEVLSPALKTQVNEDVFSPAQAYFDLLHQAFLPAVAAGDTDAARKAFTQLDQIYDQHRKAVDTLVVDALKEQAQIEKQAKEAVDGFDLLLGLVLGVSLILVVMVITLVMGGLRRRMGGEPMLVEAVLEKVTRGNLATAKTGLRPDTDSLLGQAYLMQERLRKILGAFADMATELDASAVRLRKEAGESEQEALVQQDDARTMAAAVEELSSSIEMLSSNSRQQLMLAKNSHRESERGSELVEQCIDVLRRTADFVKELSGNVQSLNDNYRRIESITLSIKDVAEQTNLLALNAAIEAARAGESGRGFAVVSDEVRSLSSRTRLSTQDLDGIVARVSDEVNTIVLAVQSAVHLTQQGVKSAEQINQTITSMRTNAHAVEQYSQSVSTALTQQSEATLSLAKDVTGISTRSEMQAEQARLATQSSEKMVEMAASMRANLRHFSLE